MRSERNPANEPSAGDKLFRSAVEGRKGIGLLSVYISLSVSSVSPWFTLFVIERTPRSS
jgi:hypothetical protein